MNKDFATMKTNVGKSVRDTSAAFATLIGVFINNRHDRVIRTLVQEELFQIHRTLTITTVDGTSTYALPFDFESMVRLHDDTNTLTLDEISEQEFWQRFGVAITTKGPPIVYLAYADGQVSQQPSSASVLSIVSSSTSDITQTVRIRGISGGVEVAENLTLNGTTSISTVNSYTEVYQIAKSATTVGTVTVTANSAATTQATIPPGALHAAYQRLKLHYVPAGAYTISGTYKRRVLPMVNDYDLCISQEVTDIVEQYAIGDAWRQKRQFAKAASIIGEATGMLNEYLFRNAGKTNRMHQFPVMAYPRNDA